jgi:hypothetical protein
MIIGNITKQPAEVVDVDIDYTSWLQKNDAIINASVVSDITGIGITTVEVYNTYIRVWVSRGNNDTKYKLTVTATTDQGRVKEDEIIVKVKEI